MGKGSEEPRMTWKETLETNLYCADVLGKRAFWAIVSKFPVTWNIRTGWVCSEMEPMSRKFCHCGALKVVPQVQFMLWREGKVCIKGRHEGKGLHQYHEANLFIRNYLISFSVQIMNLIHVSLKFNSISISFLSCVQSSFYPHMCNMSVALTKITFPSPNTNNLPKSTQFYYEGLAL